MAKQVTVQGGYAGTQPFCLKTMQIESRGDTVTLVNVRQKDQWLHKVTQGGQETSGCRSQSGQEQRFDRWPQRQRLRQRHRAVAAFQDRRIGSSGREPSRRRGRSGPQ